MSEQSRVALLLIVAVLVYGSTLPNGFALDDGLYIVRNPAVTTLSISELVKPNKDSNVFRPVTFLTFALNWGLAGARPWTYHLFNLLLHAAFVWMLYLVLRALLQDMEAGATVAWVTALLFAVHPVHTDAVASIVGRAELLAAGFVFAAWLLHLRDQPIASLVCFILALLSKESAVAFVPLALAGDYARGKPKSLYRYASVTLAAIVYVAVLWKIQGGRFGQKQVPFTENLLVILPPGLRILNALRVAWKYIGVQVYPATLSCDYYFDSIPLYSTWRHTAPAAIAALLVLALWAWTLWTKRTGWFLAGAIYLAGFAVTANIVMPIGTIMGERLAYLPSAGFCLLCAMFWIRLQRAQRRLAWMVLGIVVTAFAARTMVRNFDWRDNFTLFLAAERAVPENASIHDGLAGQYGERGDSLAAFAETEATVRIYPDFPEDLKTRGIPEADFRLLNLAAQLIKKGESEDALNFVNLAIKNSPKFSQAWSNRAVIRFQRGEFASAREDAQNALRLDATNMQAQQLLDQPPP